MSSSRGMGTRPACTAALTAAGLPVGISMSRPVRAAFSEDATAPQSEVTNPSKAHWVRSTPVSSGWFSQARAPAR